MSESLFGIRSQTSNQDLLTTRTIAMTMMTDAVAVTNISATNHLLLLHYEPIRTERQENGMQQVTWSLSGRTA